MFNFTEEQLMIRDTVRDFAETEVLPKAAELDETSAFPHKAVATLTEMGMIGLAIPEEFGGSGIDDEVMKALVIEEIAKVCASTACVASISTSNKRSPVFTRCPACT